MTPDQPGGAPAYGYLGDKEALLNRLRRIEGQVRGIGRMVDEERYCIEILTQLSAISSALDAVALELLGDHVQSRVAAFASGDRAAAEGKTREVLAAVERFAKAR